MKKNILAYLLPVILIPLLFILFLYYRSGEGIRFMKALGNGINIGNDLDVTGVSDYRENPTVYDYETYWGNVPVSGELFAAIREAGFETVRIPVSWGEHLDADGAIAPEWLDRVQEVVDQALAEDLYVILDTHHEDWLVPTAYKEPAVTEELTRIWRQLAERFYDYDERLMFESMNEPRLVGTDQEWTEGTAEARAVINRLNAAFVETVRSSGGKNEDRWLLLPGYCTGNRAEVLEAIELPADKHLIVAVHAYLPYRFTGTEQGDGLWREEDPEYTGEIVSLRENIERLFLDRRIPVVITEYGCKRKASEGERLAWASYYTEVFREIGVPCIWWDNGKYEEYGVLDRETAVVTEQSLVKILVDKNGKA